MEESKTTKSDDNQRAAAAAAAAACVSPSSALLAYPMRLRPGTDVLPALETFLAANHIQSACILSVVGSLTDVTLRYANQPSSDVRPLATSHYEVVSMSGMLGCDSGMHIHCSVADEKGTCIGGHMMRNKNIVYTTMEIVLGVMPDVTFKRETDATFGYEELVVYQNKTRSQEAQQQQQQQQSSCNA